MKDLTTYTNNNTKRINSGIDLVTIGQWYWVKNNDEAWKPRARKAVFRWDKSARSYYAYDPDDEDNISRKLIVPIDKLFNVSAYKPGDYLQFFVDPRTREQYLKWANCLLAAEEYHAGNLAAQKPTAKKKRRNYNSERTPRKWLKV